MTNGGRGRAGLGAGADKCLSVASDTKQDLNPVTENEFRHAEVVALSHDRQKKAVQLRFACEKVQVGYVTAAELRPALRQEYRATSWLSLS